MATGFVQGTPSVPRPERLFPLVRHLSCQLTPWLCRLGIRANTVTGIWILLELVGNAFFWYGGRTAYLTGALLYVFAYVLDNCDGEVARLRREESRFGDLLGEVGDWLASATLFLALGASTARADGHALWLWLGGLAAFGATLNLVFMVSLKKDLRLHAGDAESTAPLSADEVARITAPASAEGSRWWDHAVYAMRELFKADFCFLILALAALDALWLLLPAAAIGAQVYWIPALFEKSRAYHS